MMGLSPPDEKRIKQANELLQPETEMEEEDEEDMNEPMDDVTKLYKVVAAQENDEDEGEDYDYTEEELAWLDRIDKEILRQEEQKERARVDEDREPMDDRTEEEKEAARLRFSGPIISYLWHPDGTPFSDEEYRERGIEPPPPGEQEELTILEE